MFILKPEKLCCY